MIIFRALSFVAATLCFLHSSRVLKRMAEGRKWNDPLIYTRDGYRGDYRKDTGEFAKALIAGTVFAGAFIVLTVVMD